METGKRRPERKWVLWDLLGPLFPRERELGMVNSWSCRGSAEDEEVDHGHDTYAEEEGVGLQVAELEEAQDEAEAPGGAAKAAHDDAIENPFIEPTRYRRPSIGHPGCL